MGQFAPIADLPIAEIVFNGYPTAATDYQNFLSSNRESRILIEVNALPVIESYVNTITPHPIGGQPILDFPQVFQPSEQVKFLFSNGPWYGRPQDIFRPNQMAIPRVSLSSDITLLMPISPETARRGSVTAGNIELINTDGGLNDFLNNYSIGDQIINLYLGPAHGDFREFSLIGQLNGDQFETTYDVVRMLVKPTSSYLDTPVYYRKYDGSGGVGGDLSLTGTVVPVCYGECFNITPVLIDAGHWIYQFHDSPALAVDAVKERGVPFVYDGDVADYPTLITTTVDPGHYVTCLQLACFKAGFAGSPAGPITADVRGDVDNAGYTDQTGPILLKLAQSRAGLGVEYLYANTFQQLPGGTVGYYTGTNAVNVSAIFDALLSGINGWYGSDRSKLLKVGYIQEPQSQATNFDIVEDITLDIQQMQLPQPARYKQTVLYRYNFTPMSDSDVSLILDASIRAQLIGQSQSLTETNNVTKLRERSAIIGTDITTYFKTQDDARGTLDRVMNLYKEARRQWRVTLPRQGYLVSMQQYVTLTNKFMGITTPKNCVVLGLKDSGTDDTVELTLWG